MDDDKDKSGVMPGGEAAKRTPPTIDLAASEVTESPRVSDAPAAHERDHAASAAESSSESAAESSSAASRPAPVLVPAVSGIVAALLVIGAATLAGWPEKPAPIAPLADNIASNKAEIAALGARVAKVESAAAKPVPRPATDPAIAARLDAVEKSLASLRGELAAVRGQNEKTAAALGEIKSASPQGVTATESPAGAAVDMSGIEQRLEKIERATATLTAAAAAPAPQPPPEDPNVRRLDAVMELDKAMRYGGPYAPALAAARSVAGDSDALKALDPFAHTGIPGAGALCKELLAVLPQLAPKPEAQPAPSGIVERLQQSLTKLVRIQRTDTPASGTAGIIARATAAAQRNDLDEAKRELLQLPPSDRAPARPWIAKAEARDKALAASEQFTMDTLAAISKRAR
jgi:hypothetical protein